MSKHFTTVSTTYEIGFKAFDRMKFVFVEGTVTLDTKSKTQVKKHISSVYHVKTTDINITDIKPITTKTIWRVDADIATIIAACEAAGITCVIESPSNDTPSDDIPSDNIPATE